MVSFVLFLASFCVWIDPDEFPTIRRFSELHLEDPLPEALSLHEAGQVCKAMEYLDTYMDYDHVKTNSEIIAFYTKLETERWTLLQRTKNIASGAILGTTDCTEALVAATVSDFLLVGDVRDFSFGVFKKLSGSENNDDFTTALAGVGLLLWGAASVNIGTAPIHGGSGVVGVAAAKGSVSLLKMANKMGKLQKPFKASLTNLFSKIARTGDFRLFNPTADAIHQVANVPGIKLRDTFTILARTADVSDLGDVAKASKVFGPKTGKFFERAGDSSLTIFKKYGSNPLVNTSLDSAISYGKNGIRLLEKVGPQKFTSYVTFAKFGVRGLKSWHGGRLAETIKFFPPYMLFLMRWLLSFLPLWLIYIISCGTGMIVIGVPVHAGSKIIREFLRPKM